MDLNETLQELTRLERGLSIVKKAQLAPEIKQRLLAELEGQIARLGLPKAASEGPAQGSKK